MKIFWLDVETTGLNPDKDTLERPFNVGPIRNPAFRFADVAALSPYILDMHTKNGLLAACARSTTTVAEIEEHLLTLVPEVTGDDKPTLAGSSVHFDHGFLRVHMPRLAARFSHRHYDVSAVKLFCRSLGMTKVPKAEAHRARADILESIEHARVCAEWLRSFAYADLHRQTVAGVEDLKGGT